MVSCQQLPADKLSLNSSQFLCKALTLCWITCLQSSNVSSSTPSRGKTWLQRVWMSCAHTEVCAGLVWFAFCAPSTEWQQILRNWSLFLCPNFYPERDKGVETYSKHLGTNKTWKSCTISPQKPTEVRNLYTKISREQTWGYLMVWAGCSSSWFWKAPPHQHTHPDVLPLPPNPWDDLTVGTRAVRFTSHLGILFFESLPDLHMLTFSSREEWSFTHNQNCLWRLLQSPFSPSQACTLRIWCLSGLGLFIIMDYITPITIHQSAFPTSQGTTRLN